MKALSLLVLIAFLTACNHKNEHDHSAFEIDVVQKKIHEDNLVYSERFFKNDPVWYAEKYCKDAVVMPDRMAAVSGVEAISKYYFNDGKNEPGFKISIVETNVYGCRKVVVEEGIYDIPDGKGGSLDKGKFIGIWKEEGGKWKLFREIWNSDITSPAQ